MKKRIFSLMAVLAMSMALLSTAYAAPIGSGVATVNSSVSTDNQQTKKGGFDYSAPDGPADIFGIEDVSVDDVANKLNTKGNDIVTLMQVIGRYVCYGGFIFGVILMVIGAVGNKKMVWTGFIALLISGLAYAGIVCGREIVMFIASWAAS